MEKHTSIYVAGHTGLVGSAIVRKLRDNGFSNVITRTRKELNLLDKEAVYRFFSQERPRYVVDSAAKVGGIKANVMYPADFLYENLQIQNNLIWAAKKYGVKKFLFLGSSCVYPLDTEQPMNEATFGAGSLEPANEAYAYAKIVGMKLCEYLYDQYNRCFLSCMPTNIYGEGDNFDSKSSHVIPSLMRRMHEAKINSVGEVIIWGTGKVRREFLYVNDLADAIIWMLANYSEKQFLNIGTGKDVTIKELALKIQRTVGYRGRLVFDPTKPDGIPRRLLDVSKINGAGWQHNTTLDVGLKKTYDWFLANTNK